MAQHIIVGECMVEMSSRGDNLYYQTFAGDTFNTAVYFKRCNPTEQVAYWTAVGDDNISQQWRSLLASEQLDPWMVQSSADCTLGLYMIDTDASGERSFAYWRSNSAARQVMSLSQATMADPRFSQAKSLFLSGISLAILSDDDKQLLLDQVSRLKQQGCLIIFDPNYRPRLWRSVEHARLWTDRAYALADIAFPGCDDHRQLYNHQSLSDVQLHVRAMGVQEIVIKNGEHGIQIFSQGQHSIVPAHKVDKVIDTTAAGDAFNGGYLAARFAGHSEQSSASFAAKVAAYVIGFRGAIVDKRAMATFVQSHWLG